MLGKAVRLMPGRVDRGMLLLQQDACPSLPSGLNQMPRGRIEAGIAQIVRVIKQLRPVFAASSTTWPDSILRGKTPPPADYAASFLKTLKCPSKVPFRGFYALTGR